MPVVLLLLFGMLCIASLLLGAQQIAWLDLFSASSDAILPKLLGQC